MKKDWVDFKTVKQNVTIQQVLDRYEINWLRKTGDNLRGKCPIHKGEGERTFHVSLAKNAFHCFSCHAKGNVLDLVAALEKVSVREAALKLQEWFLGGAAASGEGEREAGPEKSAPALPGEPEKATEPAVVNPPLTFQLRVGAGHEYGQSRGLTRETLEYFGAGLCLSKGMFAGRFVVPLHDEQGRLVGYAGRSIDGKEPKYLFPSGEKGFHKKYLLFNLHRALKEASGDDPVVVVEGFIGCMRVKEAAGFPCVAIMGSSLSEEQEELLVEHFNRVVLLFDGDDAGRAAAEDCVRRLARKIFVRAIYLADGKQPDILTTEELQALLKK